MMQNYPSGTNQVAMRNKCSIMVWFCSFGDATVVECKTNKSMNNWKVMGWAKVLSFTSQSESALWLLRQERMVQMWGHGSTIMHNTIQIELGTLFQNIHYWFLLKILTARENGFQDLEQRTQFR